MDQSLATLLACFESHRAFAAVHMVRLVSADSGLDVSAAFTDHQGRPIVDAIPDVDVYDVEPVTLRCPVSPRVFCINSIVIEAA